METPEKVYLLFNRPYLVDYTKLNKRRCDEEVEYTCTDAIIEKAVEYIANNMRCDGYTLQTKAKFIKEFRNYLKGDG